MTDYRTLLPPDWSAWSTNISRPLEQIAIILAIQTATASAQVAGVGTRKKNVEIVEQKFIMEKYTNFLEKNCTYFICDKNELSL